MVFLLKAYFINTKLSSIPSLLRDFSQEEDAASGQGIFYIYWDYIVIYNILCNTQYFGTLPCIKFH